MFDRNSLKELVSWKADPYRKPLIIRGARQTGKTTLVELFSRQFEHFVTLNLERSSERRIWQGDPELEDILKGIEYAKQTRLVPGKTLLFLDEIQHEPKAVQTLRYFYEQRPDLHVMATGSLLEVALKNKGFSFPVGRVSFHYLYPLSFDEFLAVHGRKDLAEELAGIRWNARIPSSVHALASELFGEYTYVGGMPEMVGRYVEEKSYLPLRTVAEDLLASFEEDVPKYATPAQAPYVRFLIRHAPLFAGQRVRYANFADSGYRSREMRHAFDILESAMILQRCPGTVGTEPPLLPQTRVGPKLLYLDAGLVCQRLVVDPRSLKTGELNHFFRGALAEQIVGQELLAQNPLRRESPCFWFRDRPGSTAEVDFCVTAGGRAIPVEVKSGKAGRLRSLSQWRALSPHGLAARVYSGRLQCDDLSPPGGRTLKLLSVPFYLGFNLRRILEGWAEETGGQAGNP